MADNTPTNIRIHPASVEKMCNPEGDEKTGPVSAPHDPLERRRAQILFAAALHGGPPAGFTR